MYFENQNKLQHVQDEQLKKPDAFGFIAVGMNLGSQESFPGRIQACLDGVGFRVVCWSSWHITRPLGPNQPQYLNAVVKVTGCFSEMDALLRIRQIESAMGRQRLLHWGARVADLDLLSWGDTVLQSKELTLPHPELQHRPFVLFPWEEIAPGYVVPGLGETVKSLADRLRTLS